MTRRGRVELLCAPWFLYDAIDAHLPRPPAYGWPTSLWPRLRNTFRDVPSLLVDRWQAEVSEQITGPARLRGRVMASLVIPVADWPTSN